MPLRIVNMATLSQCEDTVGKANELIALYSSILPEGYLYDEDEFHEHLNRLKTNTSSQEHISDDGPSSSMSSDQISFKSAEKVH
jgi:hypothetical protein